ncbi:unnamed protein product [Enterobius vermicularis]|uniref:Acireductone dioxygenase homolog n=1 Tax=Enterobius vermicularis TaxID=51028 RepID=A0A0N4VG36_ENTVE|nr:unnamed protein product [Enterobius vermicularis]
MVQIWHLDDYMYGDPRLPHYVYPPKKLSPDDLFKRTSVKYVKIQILDEIKALRQVEKLRKEKQFGCDEFFTLDGRRAENFKSKVLKFFIEYIEKLYAITTTLDEEAHFVSEGSAYFDVLENDTTKWLRICCEAGDLLVFPAAKFYKITTTPEASPLQQ